MMEVLKKVKRKLSVVLAVAMVVTSITIPNATVVKADTPTIKDVIHSVAGQTSWDDTKSNTIVLDRSQKLSIGNSNIDISVNNVSYDVSVDEVPFVSGNAAEHSVPTTTLNPDDFSEQCQTFDVTMPDGEGNVTKDTLTVVLKAKEATVADLSPYPDAGTIRVNGVIANYGVYSAKPIVKYAFYESADYQDKPIDASMFKGMKDVSDSVSGSGAFSFTIADQEPGDYCVVVATKAGSDDYAVYSQTVKNVTVPTPEGEPDITVQFQSLDKTPVKNGAVVSFNDINVVVDAKNVPKDAKVTLKAFIPVSGGANVVLASKELVVSDNMVNAKERIQIPEDALGKQIRAEARIEDTKYYSITDVWVRQKPIFKVTKGNDSVKLSGYYRVDYDTDYTIKVWDEFVKQDAKFSIVDKDDRITVSENGLVASFKAKEEDAGKTLSYMVKSTVDGKEVEIGRIYFRVTPAYTITINDISAKKGKYTVSNNKAVEGTRMAGTVIDGGIVITAEEGYVLSEVNVNGKKLNERLVKSFTITNTKDEKNFEVDENYVIKVKTVASVANKAEITISKKVNENEYVPLKNGATINCGDKIKIEAYKDGTKLDVSENLVVMHKARSGYVECINSGLTIEGEGIGTIQNIVSGEQLQVVIKSKDGQIKYATYNFKVSKLAEKILVNKKPTETIEAEQANVKECQLTADGYINFSVANKDALEAKHIVAEVIDNKTLRIEVYPEAKADKYEITVSGNNASGSKIVDVTTAKVELTVKEPAWKDAEITLTPSTKYTSYKTIGFVPTFADKKFKDLKAGNNFLSEYTFKWYYKMYDDKGEIELEEHYSEENDIKVEPKDIVLKSGQAYRIEAKLRLVKNVEKVREFEIESNKASEASIKTFDDLKTEKIGFKKKSSAAYTGHTVELATLTYDKNTGRRLSDYYDVRLYDQNGDIIVVSGNKAAAGKSKPAVWLENGSLVAYVPFGTEGKKFTAEVYAKDKDPEDADVVAKTTFTVKKSIETIHGYETKVFKKENKALKVSLKPGFNYGTKAPASKKVSYSFVGKDPEGVTLKGNTITIAKDAKVDKPIKVTVTAEDVKDYDPNYTKKTGTITVNVRTSASNAVAVYVAEEYDQDSYKTVDKLIAGKTYCVILTTKEATKEGICFKGDLVSINDFYYTRDKSMDVAYSVPGDTCYRIKPTVAKKNAKITATAYDGVKKTTKVNVIPQTLDFDKLSIEFGGKVSNNKIEISTTSVDRHDLNVLLNGDYINPSVYGLTMKVSGLKYNKDFGGYVMTGKTASIKVKGKDVKGKNVDKTFTIENKQYAALEKAPKLKADKKFTVVNAANKGNTAVSLNKVTIKPASGYASVSTDVVNVRVLCADSKSLGYYNKLDFKSLNLNRNDGSFTLSLDGKEVPAGNVKLTVYYMGERDIPLTKPATITIPVQKMKYSFKLSSGIKFAAGSTSVNLVPKYDKNNVAKVEYTGDGLGAQNAFIKGKGEYNLFATKYFSIDNAGKLTFSSNGTIDSVYKLVTDKDAKVNKNGVIKAKVTYNDGAVRYYTTNVTVSQAKK